MTTLIYVIVVVVLSLVLHFGYEVLRTRFIGKTMKSLAATGDINQFGASINSTQGKLYFPKAARLLFELDGYLSVHDVDGVNQVYEETKTKRYNMDTRFKIEARMFMLQLLKNDETGASATLDKMKQLVQGTKREAEYSATLKEYEYQLEIGLRRNGDYAQEMLDCAEASADEKNKGVYLFRAATCYYYKNDEDKAFEYLKQAKPCLENTELGKVIGDILKTKKLSSLETVKK
ncbi:MAG: hypothetical protein ACK5LZ_07015 [Anaerorhabdus sp.]